MDELIVALAEMKWCSDDFLYHIENELNQILHIINDTQDVLGNDELGMKTINMLLPVMKSLREVYDNIDELSKVIGKKGIELIEIIESTEEGTTDSQAYYGQKNIHKELFYSRRR